jgi:hypothetical protein
MFTAFDLLAKLQLGDKDGPGKRFKAFLTSAAGMQRSDAELFYAVRNSLTHAFGVPDIDSLAKLGLQGVELRRRGETQDGLAVVQRRSWGEPSRTVAILYIDGAFRTLMTTLRNYRRSLSESVEARRQFDQMFDKYGMINMA